MPGMMATERTASNRHPFERTVAPCVSVPYPDALSADGARSPADAERARRPTPHARSMTNLTALDVLLRESSDPANPDAAGLLDIMRSVRTIAVVGMSRDRAKAARRVPSYLAAKGYDVLPVNPFATRILGRPARKSLAEVTEPVDMVVIFRPSAEAGTHLAEAAARPERPVVWLQQEIRADEEAAEARARGIRVVQDMCTYQVHRAATADR